ncbi:MAG: hypothetical protein Q8O40_13280, partial [Chloroflexota bacterium]|nr:hypothetical protein [Chloroflexota bacterium]
DNERLNSKAMYRIYQDKKLSDTDDELDDVAAYQRGAALLQRIQAEYPELWNTITHHPDGIRSAVQVPKGAEEDAEAVRFAQGVLDIEGAQMPLMSPAEQAGVASPFDGPNPGETVVLLSTGGVRDAYAVGDDLAPRKVTSGQLISAVECRPDTPASPLPPKTNERVMATFVQFKEESHSHLGRARRPASDSRLRRYLSKQLTLLRSQYKDNPTELRRVDTLRLIFLDHLPPRVEAALRDVRDLGLEGDALIRRLEALRGRYRLSPPDPEETAEREPEVVRIVCSDGLK